MAIINLDIIIPDGQVARVQNALRTYWGEALTGAEITECIRVEIIDRVKGIVEEVERRQAVNDAIASVTSADIT